MIRKRLSPMPIIPSLVASLTLFFMVSTTTVMAAQNHNSSRSNAPGEGYGLADKAERGEIPKSKKQGDPNANRYDFGNDSGADATGDNSTLEPSIQQQKNPLYKAPVNKKENPMFEE